MLSRREPTVEEGATLVQAGFCLYDGRDWKAEAEKMYGSSSGEIGRTPLTLYSDSPDPDLRKVLDLGETFICISEEKKTMVAIQAVNVVDGRYGYGRYGYLSAWITQMIGPGVDGKPASIQGVVYTLDYVMNMIERGAC
jgi:hypothetical protein